MKRIILPVLLFLSLGAGKLEDAETLLNGLADEWRKEDAATVQFRVMAEPIVEGALLWDENASLIFPQDRTLAHPTQKPLLADETRLVVLRDTAKPMAWERASGVSDTYYWCRPDICFAVNAPALAEAVGHPPQEFETLFARQENSVLPYVLAIIAMLSAGAIPLVLRKRRQSETSLPEDPDAFDFGVVRINPNQMTAVSADHSAGLSERDLKLIVFFRENRGAVLAKDQLYDVGWGRDFMPNSRALDQHILTLRRKLAPDRSDPIIETVHGRGYRFIG